MTDTEYFFKDLLKEKADKYYEKLKKKLMNIKILDCTLRDGGYINNWKFSQSQISKVVSTGKIYY